VLEDRAVSSERLVVGVDLSAGCARRAAEEVDVGRELAERVGLRAAHAHVPGPRGERVVLEASGVRRIALAGVRERCAHTPEVSFRARADANPAAQFPNEVRVTVAGATDDERRRRKPRVEPRDGGAIVIDVDAHGANPAVRVGRDLRARDGANLRLRVRADGKIVGG